MVERNAQIVLVPGVAVVPGRASLTGKNQFSKTPSCFFLSLSFALTNTLDIKC